jgi:drug/metabolite transporter (DMT)-like permease
MSSSARSPSPSGPDTALGLVSVLLWGTSIAVNRLIVDGIGLLRGPLVSTAASGVVGIIFLAVRRGELARLRGLPAAYWAACGSLFVSYTVAYNLGVGLSRGGRQLLVFSILNYLWPVLTVAFSAVMFKRRVRPWFAAGLGLALAAILLAFLSRPAGRGGPLTFTLLLGDIRGNPAVYALGLYCGVAWALYSNLGRRIAGPSSANPVPILFLASAAVFGAAWLLGAGCLDPSAARPPRWEAASVGALAYRALFVDLAAYAFWDAAMRRGSQMLVAAASFFTPVLSTASIAVILGIAPGWLFWAACGLAIGGAVLCNLSVRDGRSA